MNAFLVSLSTKLPAYISWLIWYSFCYNWSKLELTCPETQIHDNNTLVLNYSSCENDNLFSPVYQPRSQGISLGLNEGGKWPWDWLVTRSQNTNVPRFRGYFGSTYQNLGFQNGYVERFNVLRQIKIPMNNANIPPLNLHRLHKLINSCNQAELSDGSRAISRPPPSQQKCSGNEVPACYLGNGGRF